MSARLVGSRGRDALRDPAALARFVEAWNAGVDLVGLSRRFNLGRSTCVVLARRLRDQGQAVRPRRGGPGGPA